MVQHNRREFLIEVGRGMFTASLGLTAASQLALASSLASQDPVRLTFGAHEPLVDLLMTTPADRLAEVLVARLRAGTTLQQMVTAAALANARTFGGEDYVGFHTMMALAPAYRMALELPLAQQPLPVLKVLYRNSHRIQEYGGSAREVLHPVVPGKLPADQPAGEALRAAVRGTDLATAEAGLAALASDAPQLAFDALLYAVQDATEVHRVVLPHRAWDLLDIIGKEHAQTLLRQSVHYCVQSEGRLPGRELQPRELLPKLLDQHKLLGKSLGTRTMEDGWIERLSLVIFGGSPSTAAEAVAATLAEGIAPEQIGEAIALAANQLVLRDHGRTGKEVQAGKPAGSVHGDSIGVHACDSANAWRGMARAGSPRNTFASLILGGYQVAFDRQARGGDFLAWQPQPLQEQMAKITLKDQDELLRATDAAIRDHDQAQACALVTRYGTLGLPTRPVFDLMLRYATSEDGALHAEKFYRTSSEEFAAARPAFRWRYLGALARVTASESGQPAPGHAAACELLRV